MGKNSQQWVVKLRKILLNTICQPSYENSWRSLIIGLPFACGIFGFWSLRPIFETVGSQPLSLEGIERMQSLCSNSGFQLLLISSVLLYMIAFIMCSVVAGYVILSLLKSLSLVKKRLKK